MREILSIVMLQFRLVMKSKSMVINMFAVPLLLTLIFGALFSQGGSAQSGARRFPVAVVDEDASFASRLLTDALEQEGTLTVRIVTSGAVPRLFADRKIESAIIIPIGFQSNLTAGRATEVQLMPAPGGNLQVGVGPVVSRETARIAGDFRLALGLADSGAMEDRVVAEYDRVLQERRATPITARQEQLVRSVDSELAAGGGLGEVALGFIILFVMLIVFMMSGTILQERQTGTWGRLLTTPTGRIKLVAGYLLSFFVTGMFQFCMLVFATILLFGARWGPLLPLFTIAAAFVLCSAALGLFVAGIVRTAEQQRTIGVVLVNATSMLGGVYWPLEMVGEPMRRVGYLTPQAWAMEGFREVMLRGGGIDGLLWPLAVLLGLTVILMTAGLARIRYE